MTTRSKETTALRLAQWSCVLIITSVVTGAFEPIGNKVYHTVTNIDFSECFGLCSPTQLVQKEPVVDPVPPVVTPPTTAPEVHLIPRPDPPWLERMKY